MTSICFLIPCMQFPNINVESHSLWLPVDRLSLYLFTFLCVSFFCDCFVPLWISEILNCISSSLQTMPFRLLCKCRNQCQEGVAPTSEDLIWYSSVSCYGYISSYIHKFSLRKISSLLSSYISSYIHKFSLRKITLWAEDSFVYVDCVISLFLCHVIFLPFFSLALTPSLLLSACCLIFLISQCSIAFISVI